MNVKVCVLERAKIPIFQISDADIKCVWPGTYRSSNPLSPTLQPQPEQGAGLHKIEATVREVENSMLTNPPFMGIKMTVC